MAPLFALLPARSPAFGLALAAVLAGCGVGPEPRDLSNATPIPIRNTAARVQNQRAITRIDDSPAVLAVLAEPDRPAEDRALDEPYQTADVLTYLGVTPGMRVAELGAGGGYLTELLARSVGASGLVFAQSSPSLPSQAGTARLLDARLARLANPRVVRDEREIAAPFPEPARGLDLVYLRFFYGDLAQRGVDRRVLLANVYDALRPGGRFVTIDRTPPQRNRAVDLGAMRVEASRNARYEIERAGFHFVSEGRFLRGSAAPQDWDAASTAAPTPNDTQERFFLTFAK
jgi:predicted methyltransferase